VPASSAVASIERHDSERDPRRLRLRYDAMAADAFSFFRGTCHLFYGRLSIVGPLRDAPTAWVCGDLHFENFGSFKGENGLTYFDVNDFDESCLAPCTWDVARFQASLLLGAASIGVRTPRAARLAQGFLDEYAAALADGRAMWIERDTAEGMVRDLLDAVRGRKRKDLLDKRAPRKGGGRRIATDDPPRAESKALATSPRRDRAVRAALASVARESDHPDRLDVLDVADRVAGTGSLGVDRYVVLTEGKGSPDENYLLDLKAAGPAAPAALSPVVQPAWPSEAARVVACQRRLQAESPKFLSAVQVGGDGFVLRELLPSEDRVDLASRDGGGDRLEAAVRDMARIVAWAHLRGARRESSASADDLEAFGRSRSWCKPLTRLATAAARDASADHAAFKTAWADGRVALPPPWE
jgi:uncharacterized protein (DUF2252 family)